MNISVDIITNSRQNVLLASNSFIKTQNGTSYVEVMLDDGSIESRQVEIGLSSGTQTEIISGLEEGEETLEDSGTWWPGDRGTGRQGDLGTGRQGDGETGRPGDKGTGRQGDRALFCLQSLDVIRLGISFDQFFVVAAAVQEFLVGAGFDDLALTHHQDAVSFEDRIQPVGDGDHSSSFHQSPG